MKNLGLITRIVEGTVTFHGMALTELQFKN
jgi:hypothetical protein